MSLIFKNEEEFKKKVKELKNEKILPKNISDYEHEPLMFDERVEKVLDNLIDECLKLNDNILDSTEKNTYINNAKNIAILKAFFIGNFTKERNVSVKNLSMASIMLINNNKKLILDKTLNVMAKKVNKDKKSLVNNIKKQIKDNKDINLLFKFSVLESIIFEQEKNVIFNDLSNELLKKIHNKQKNEVKIKCSNKVEKEMLERLKKAKNEPTVFELNFPSMKKLNDEYPYLNLRLIFEVVSENPDDLDDEDDEDELGEFFYLFAEIVDNPLKKEKTKTAYEITQLVFGDYDGYTCFEDTVKNIASRVNMPSRILKDDEVKKLNTHVMRYHTEPDTDFFNLLSYLTSEEESEKLKKELESLR